MALTFSPPATHDPARAAGAARLALVRAFGGEHAWLRRLTPVLEAVGVLSIWLLSRVYRGIVHDSRIYIGRAVADLDPQGLGREPAFLYDEQTKHTVFSHLLVPLVSAFGPSATSMGVALAALLIWLAAAAWLAHRLMPRRMIPAALICAAALPAFYGPLDIFSFGEALATPRGFAEAGVLAGLACLLGGRRLLCGAFLLLAAVFHPVMAAPGFGVVFLVLAHENRRWWGLAPVGLIGLLVAGALHLGPAKTLFSAYDAEWLRALHLRDQFLFLADWPPSAWYGAAQALATLVVASMILKDRARLVVIAALIGAPVCLASSFVFGDLFDSMLIVQLQLWRTLWIVQVLAVLLVPLCIVSLWTTRRGDGRLSAVLLGLSWLELTGTPWDVPILALTLACATVCMRGGADRVPAKASIAISIAALALVLALVGVRALVALKFIHLFDTVGVPVTLTRLMPLKLHPALFLAIALVPLLFPLQIKPAVGAVGLALCVLILAPLAVLVWDQRTPTRRMTDLGEDRADLNRLIGPMTGSGVVWTADEVAPWFLLSRATWVSDLQGTIGAFSRPLAMTWNARSAAYVASGFRTIRGHANPTLDLRPLDKRQNRDSALRLCAAPQGPQAVVLAGDLTKMFGAGVAALWRAPVKDAMLKPGASTLKLTSFDSYTVVRCERVSNAGIQRNLTSTP